MTDDGRPRKIGVGCHALHPGASCRALVVIFDDDEDARADGARLSEAALAQDWDVVLVRFPFSDLSQTKLRPAIVLADAGRGDLVLCQVTSRPYGDAAAEPLAPADFRRGRLPGDSYVRPARLFTAHADLVAAVVGTLRDDARERAVA